MNKIYKNILNKINSGEIQQLPKWYFYLLHAIVILAIVIISIVGVYFWGVFFSSSDPSGAYLNFQHKQPIPSHLKSVPKLFPVVPTILVFFISILSFFLIRKTENGYKINWYKILAIFIIPQLLLGALLHLSAITQDKPNWDYLNIIKHEQEKRIDYWNMPKEGRLVGEIHQENNQLILITPTAEQWHLLLAEPINKDLKSQKFIRVIGEDISTLDQNNTFQVHRIQPLKPKDFIKRPPN